VTLTYIRAPRFEMIDNTVAVYRITAGNVPGLDFLSRALGTFLCLVRLHRRHPIDILHHGHVYHMGLGVTLFKKMTRIPLVNTLLGRDTFSALKTIPAVFNPYLAWVMNSADVVVTMTRHMVEAARKQGCRTPIRIIPHGASIRGMPQTFSIRTKHAIPETWRICFSLQRLDPRKALDILLDAVPHILAQYPQTVFIIAGEGPEEVRLKELAVRLDLKEQVIFTGFVPIEDQPAYYAQSTLFVLPSLYESFGIVYADALSMGIPVVTTAQGGALDIIGADTGILAPPGSSTALAQGIMQAFERSWNPETIRQSSAVYDWDRVADAYRAIYESLFTTGEPA
jgi:glycosyltransferase involved in cell wall biosynthesis